MGLKVGRLLFFVVALVPAINSYGDDTQQFVQRAVQVELAKDRNDHSHWIYFEADAKDGHRVRQWVADTGQGSLKRVISMDGKPVPEPEQRHKMESYLRDSSTRSKQRKSEQHDDEQATQMLNMLPQAFIWTKVGTKGDLTLLHFKPNPSFNPPNLEGKVFAAMEGDMAVDTKQLRIASLKGRLTHDVLILGGFLGRLNGGGTFNVERRETGNQVWQITETHVHIQGHALLFKTISEQEDDVKTQFQQLDSNVTLQQAEGKLLTQGK